MKHDAKGKELKDEAAKLREERTDEISEENGNGKEKELQTTDDHSDDDNEDEDVEERGLPKTPAGDEHRHKRAALKQRLREGRLLMHRVHFLLGDVQHVLGDTVMEEASYEAAERLRRELLKSMSVLDLFGF